MKSMSHAVVGSAIALVTLVALGARADSSSPPATAAKLGMPTSTPQAQGFSAAQLVALDQEMHSLVDNQKLAGVTTLLARHGKVVHFDTYGKANIGTGAELQPDSIFRIASMTKPIVGAAMMQLYEQGKWKLDDPVAKYIPEFANLQVKKTDGSTEPMQSTMTMAQLMSHTAGFGVNNDYISANFAAGDLQAMIDKLAKMPLFSQPGTDWAYGPAVSIQGYVVEKLSGQTLDVYLSEHIFKPLGMQDTGFWVPPEKADRVVAIHTYDENGKIKAPPENKVTTAKPIFLSGSGGLMSTMKDYWRFSQAMLNGGVLDGKRILKPQTVALMRKNVVPAGVDIDLFGPAIKGTGFGLDFAIVLDPQATGSPQGVNTFYWGGAFGTWFWIDPTNDLIFVGMIQNLNGSTPSGGTPNVREVSSAATYRALQKH